MAQRDRRKPRLFYGWLLVFVSAVKGSFNVGSSVFASSIFLLPMQQDLGWSRAVFFGALGMRSAMGGLLGPVVGPIGDSRWAPRLFVPIGVLLMGISFMLVRWVETPLQYYLIYGLVGAAGQTLTSPIILDAIVVKWFVRKRAQALMWSQLGPPTGPLLFPIILTALIATVGWRWAWVWMGAVTIAILLPLSLLIRTYPQDMGLLPDGDPGEEALGGGPEQRTAIPQEYSYTRREAMRTTAFWTLTLAIGLGMFGVPGFQAHWIPYMQEAGFSPDRAATVLVVFGGASMLSRFAWGFLSSRYSIRLLLGAQGIVEAVVVALLLTVHGSTMLFAWAIVQGFSLGGFFQLQALIVANYFGREHMGAIRGIMFPLTTILASTGPIVLGALRDSQGSYEGAFGLLVITWFLGGLLVLTTRPPQRTLQEMPASPAQRPSS